VFLSGLTDCGGRLDVFARMCVSPLSIRLSSQKIDDAQRDAVHLVEEHEASNRDNARGPYRIAMQLSPGA
jgi:hypothetical protein